MNSIKHAQISARRRGGLPEDYIEIHQFIDSTKNICSDNRHRIFHTIWAVNEIIIPIFGHQIVNSDGNVVDVKDICEKDHLLVDYRHKFIPTLSDFVRAMDIEVTRCQRQTIEKVHAIYTQSENSKDISRLLLSPLALTGDFKSLLITHNSWFLLAILPRILEKTYKNGGLRQFELNLILQNFPLSADVVFNSMDYKSWMNHGAGYPPSAQKLKNLHS